MRFWLICLIFSWTLSVSSQKTIPYVTINSSNPTDTNYTDLAQLDSILGSRQLIGIGEATHGTSEFTTMRHRLFRYLVEKHQFNTFFLEADFGACQRVNRYIHGESDTAKKALEEVVLWPWCTEEMIGIIEWMRLHNRTNPHNQIQFVGCDAQLISSNFLELKRFLSKINSSHTTEMDKFMNREKIVHNLPFRDTLKMFLKNVEMEVLRLHLDNSLASEFTMLNQTLQMGLSYHFKVLDNSRDSCMAVNILTYLNLFPNSKGIYFAHNLHVSRYNFESNTTGIQNKWAGYYLEETLKSKYFVIGQELYEGTFIARGYEDGIWKCKEFYLPPADKKSLGYYFSNFGPVYLFCLTKHIPKLERKGNTFIGAAYGIDEKGIKHGRYGWDGKFFDAFIFIKTTTASHIY